MQQLAEEPNGGFNLEGQNDQANQIERPNQIEQRPNCILQLFRYCQRCLFPMRLINDELPLIRNMKCKFTIFTLLSTAIIISCTVIYSRNAEIYNSDSIITNPNVQCNLVNGLICKRYDNYKYCYMCATNEQSTILISVELFTPIIVVIIFNVIIIILSCCSIYNLS